MGLFRRKPTETLEERIDPTPTPVRPVLEPGVPGRCPECDGFGYIDHIDMVNRFQSQHCRSCGHSWEFRFDDDDALIDLTDAAEASSNGTQSST